MSSSAVALSVRCCNCRLSILWVLLLICSLPPSLMTALTSDLAQIRFSHKLHWPDLKILRRAPPSSSSWTMTFLPLGMIYSNWIWCERELHTVALHLPLDRSVKLYDSEHHFLFNPVRSPPLEDTLTSLCSPQTLFTYALPGIFSLMSSLLDFDDQRVCLGSMTTLWIRRGNVGVRSFCLNPTPGYSANLAKLIFQEFVIRANRSSLLDLTLLCLPVTAVCVQKPSYLVDSAFLCSSWSRRNIYSKLEGPSMEPCKLGLELQSYLYGAIVGVNPQNSSQSHHQSLPPTRANVITRLNLKWSLPKLEDCSSLGFCLHKSLTKFPHVQGHERSFPHVLLLVGENFTIKTPLHESYFSLDLKTLEYYRFLNRLVSCVMVRMGSEDTTGLMSMRTEVLERPKSQFTVTILKLEELEERYIFLWILLARTFENTSNALSNFLKFVYLSVCCFVWFAPQTLSPEMQLFLLLLLLAALSPPATSHYSSSTSSPSSSSVSEWRPARATYYAATNPRDLVGGACGYGDLVKSGYGMSTVGLSETLFERGQICGACFELRCVDDLRWCIPGTSIIVTATNFCAPNYGFDPDGGGHCNPPNKHFVLPIEAFEKIAIWKAGNMPVQYRRINCRKEGSIRFTVDGGGIFISVLITNVAGSGDISAVKIKGSRTGWLPMGRNWGQNWHINADLKNQALSFEVTSSDKSTVTAYNVAPRNWDYGQTFEGKQFETP